MKLTPEQERRIAALGADFRRKMDNLDKCPRCKKPRMSVSMGVGGGPLNRVTSPPCTCAATSKAGK